MKYQVDIGQHSTFSNPAELQFKGFVFHLIMNNIDTENKRKTLITVQ